MSEFGSLAGVRAMDLYAGSGALGIEALSRGAASVLLVESDARAAAVVKANVKAVGLPGATVTTDRVERLLARPQPERQHADLVIVYQHNHVFSNHAFSTIFTEGLPERQP